jgi:Cu(I)/Ag(I) efflux system membrane fusion protein
MTDHIFSAKRAAWLAGALALVAAVAVFLYLGSPGARWNSMRERARQLFRPPASPAMAPAHGEARILYYEDPMHPWYRSDKPGFAPDCGMKLVPVYASEAAPPASLPPGSVQISPARQQLIGDTTARAEYRTLDKTLRTVGQVDIDETRTSTVHIKVSGWVQKVFADYTLQHVMKGEPLFTIYSPDLLATEEEYLLALKAQRTLSQSPFREVGAGGESLLAAARRRLSLWDVTPEQILELEQTGKPQREITYYSPFTGHVQERKVFPNQYVTPETELYKIVDHSVVWVYAAIYESELPFVSLGQEALVTTEALPGQTFRGRVSYIWPHLMEETRTARVRVEFPNPELKLNPGMWVNVELHRSLGSQVTVPVDAVLDSGERQRVFVDHGNGYFEPREVKVGERGERFASISSGLRAGERVVTRANFLIDSESNLREAIAGMAGMPGMQHEGGGRPAPTGALEHHH